MSKSKSNLVAGRLSQPLAATGKSTYEKTRMGLTPPGQAPESPDAATPPVEPPTMVPPAMDDAPPVTATPAETVAAPGVVDSPANDTMVVEPPPAASASSAPWEMPSDNLTLVNPLESMIQGDDAPPTRDAQASDMQADNVQTGDSDASAPPPWEMPAAVDPAPADAAPQPAAPPPSAAADSLVEQVRAQAIQAWNAQQSSDWDLIAPAPPKRSAKVLYVFKVASPALGGLALLLAIMYGLWTWVNGGFKTQPVDAGISTPAAPTVDVHCAHSPCDDPLCTDPTCVEAKADVAAVAVVTVPTIDPSVDDEWDKFKTGGYKTTVEPDLVVEVPVTPVKKPIVTRAPPSNLRLMSMASTAKGRAALINNRYMYVGDRIAGATITSIGRFTVDMEMDGETGRERFTLALPAGSDPDPEPEPTPATETPAAPTEPVPAATPTPAAPPPPMPSRSSPV
jgi:hypothetical protein